MMIRILQVVFGVFMVGFAIALAVTLFLIFDPEVKPFSLFAPAPSPAGRAAGVARQDLPLPSDAGQSSNRMAASDAIAVWLAAN